jgi:hypothetical protein
MVKNNNNDPRRHPLTGFFVPIPERIPGAAAWIYYSCNISTNAQPAVYEDYVNHSSRSKRSFS